MKNLLIIATLTIMSVVTAIGQEREVYTLKNGAVIENRDFLNLDLYSKGVYNDRYKYCDDPLEVRVGNKKYDIKVANYIGYWAECDSMIMNYVGDFNVIEFHSNDGCGYQYRDDYGILKMNESSVSWMPSYSGSNYMHRGLSRNGYFVETTLTPDSKAVIFFGQSYGTDVGRTFIFIVTERDVKLVFNKPYRAKSINIANGEFRIEFQSNIQETIDGVTWTPAITHTMWLEDGVLKFRDNAKE